MNLDPHSVQLILCQDTVTLGPRSVLPCDTVNLVPHSVLKIKLRLETETLTERHGIHLNLRSLKMN